MEAIIKLKISELDDSLYRKIKNLFKGKSVTITISSEVDETEYLLANISNGKFLNESMAEEPSVIFTLADFEKHCAELEADKRKP